jgi:hypothetical protein
LNFPSSVTFSKQLWLLKKPHPGDLWCTFRDFCAGNWLAWLAGWLAGSFGKLKKKAGWLACWLACWLAGWLASWLAN